MTLRYAVFFFFFSSEHFKQSSSENCWTDWYQTGCSSVGCCPTPRGLWDQIQTRYVICYPPDSFADAKSCSVQWFELIKSRPFITRLVWPYPLPPPSDASQDGALTYSWTEDFKQHIFTWTTILLEVFSRKKPHNKKKNKKPNPQWKRCIGWIWRWLVFDEEKAPEETEKNLGLNPLGLESKSLLRPDNCCLVMEWILQVHGFWTTR